MSWEEVIGIIGDISNLQEEINRKASLELFSAILARYEKYCYCLTRYDLETYQDAILENKMRVTPIQVSILIAIEKQNLCLNIVSIYNNLSDDLEEAKHYVEEMQKKYIIANQAYQSVINLEKWAETELNVNFEETEYAKLIQRENQICLSTILEVRNGMNVDANSDIFKIIQYIESLSYSQKINLLTNFIGLSYEKNSFQFFESLKSYQILANLFSKSDIFPLYKKRLQLIKNYVMDEYRNKPLEEVISALKEVEKVMEYSKKK